ncbi:MAG: hypothetical protein LC122_14365 [Chitinophagales bacterium]|nr:hypothetical protein [Chitinophagales bacterium]
MKVYLVYKGVGLGIFDPQDDHIFATRELAEKYIQDEKDSAKKYDHKFKEKFAKLFDLFQDYKKKNDLRYNGCYFPYGVVYEFCLKNYEQVDMDIGQMDYAKNLLEKENCRRDINWDRATKGCNYIISEIEVKGFEEKKIW